jgi:hypothetical protein
MIISHPIQERILPLVSAPGRRAHLASSSSSSRRQEQGCLVSNHSSSNSKRPASAPLVGSLSICSLSVSLSCWSGATNNNQAKPGGLFGTATTQPATNAFGGGIFGQTNQQQQQPQQQQQGTGLFGQTNTTGTGLFGQTQPQQQAQPAQTGTGREVCLARYILYVLSWS